MEGMIGLAPALLLNSLLPMVYLFITIIISLMEVIIDKNEILEFTEIGKVVPGLVESEMLNRTLTWILSRKAGY